MYVYVRCMFGPVIFFNSRTIDEVPDVKNELEFQSKRAAFVVPLLDMMK